MIRRKRTSSSFSGAIGVISALCLGTAGLAIICPYNLSSDAFGARVHFAPPVKARPIRLFPAPPPAASPSTAATAPVSFLASLPALPEGFVDDLNFQPRSQTKGRLQIGVGRSIEPLVVDATTAPADKWAMLADGSRAWAVAVSSEGALGLRMHLESIHLPAGARIEVFDPADPASAPPAITAQSLGGQNQVWTPTVFSDTAIIQCEVPATQDVSSVSFRVATVSHLYVLPGSQGTSAQIQPRGEAGTCEKDVTCYPAYAQAAKGVALMTYTPDNGNTYTCSGCLLASTDPNAVNNFFLTANHCVGTQALASTIELFWFYQTSTCNGTPPSMSSVPATTGGATLLATSTANDFTFLRLTQVAPEGATPLSWSTNAPDTSEPLVIIHHPQGDYKRISFGNYYAQTADFWAVQWYLGVTEDGSSGGPLLNSQNQVIGSLTGGFDGPGSSCSDPTAPDEFGRFDVTYPQIQQWIDPGGGAGNTNEVTPVAGTYHGLFFDSGDGLTQQNSGAFTLTSSKSGKFSGHIQIGSVSSGFSGKFNSAGAAQVVIGPRSANPLTVQFQLDPADTDEISGVVTGPDFTSELTGEREIFSGSNPCPEVGRYTMVIEGVSNSNSVPAGDSYATVTVSKSGGVSMSGGLADGTKISQSSYVSKSGLWPLYVPLYKGKGSLFSLVNFVGNSGSAFGGAVSWIKPEGAASTAYEEGFTLDTTLTGSTFTKATKDAPVLDATNAAVSFTTADGSIDIVNYITFSPSGKIINLSSNKLSLSISGSTGVFSGKVENPSTGKMISFGGVILQDQNTAQGYFLDGPESGPVVISPGS